MDAEQFHRITLLVDAAVDLETGQRAAFLDRECGDDSKLRRTVQALVDENRRRSDRLTMTADQAAQDPATAPPTDRIDNYRLLHRIGEGGMGEVYLAQQERPIRRQVAVKLVRRGMDSRQVIARFESERQALALMDHPNIARVYDAGSTEQGQPYFVMEYVDGEPITRYCDRQRLATRDRLDLFLHVCDGVQHAHQKAVIHRDIKPSNVLVAVKGSRPVPKIIDFGIAKATAQQLTEKTLFTELGQLVGTPEYMSPEQANTATDAIDTRTDIYSLGVLLYEMLVGVLPFDPVELKQAGFEEILRRIREDDPPKPSTRLVALGGTTTATARQRGTNPGRLTSQLRGDLDWITMKALEKTPERRYVSPAEMADDIRRFLRDEPVLAGPPSAAYRVRKFVRRHRIGVSFAAMLLVFLVALAATMTVQTARIAREADRANREAGTARQIAEFLVGLFEVNDPGEARGNSITAREILDRGAEQVNDLDDEPLMQATFMETIGEVYTVLGLFSDARPLLEESLELRRQHGGEDELALAGCLHDLANLYDNSGEPKRAEPLARQAIEIRGRIQGEHSDLAQSLNTLGNTLWHQDRLDEAEAVHRQALALRESILDPNDPDIAQSLHNLGALRYFASDYEEAEALYRRSIEIERVVEGPDSHGMATSMHTLAIVCQDQGRYEEALELEQQSLAIRERVMGPDHWHVALSLTTLGNIYRAMDRAADAEAPMRRAVVIAQNAWGPDHPELWWMKRSLARTLIAQQKLDEAQAQLEALVARIEQVEKEGSLPLNLNTLGELHLLRKQYDQAEAMYRRSIEISEREEGADSPYVGLACAGLANVYREQDRLEEAESSYRRAIRIMEQAWGPADLDRLEAVRDYAQLLRRSGRDDEADALEAEADADDSN